MLTQLDTNRETDITDPANICKNMFTRRRGQLDDSTKRGAVHMEL